MAWLWLSVPPAHLADVGTDLAKFPEAAYVDRDHRAGEPGRLCHLPRRALAL